MYMIGRELLQIAKANHNLLFAIIYSIYIEIQMYTKQRLFLERMDIMNNKDNIGILFINLSKQEGKFFDGADQNGFVQSVFSGTGTDTPMLNELVSSEPIVFWKELRTGDVAVYSNGSSCIFGIVMGEIERQFCYAEPSESVVKIVDFDEIINGYKYINGKKVLSVEQ